MVQGLCLVILACLTLSACAMPGGVDAWVKPIYVSKDDHLTEGTAKQILIHNDTLESLDN